MNEGGIDIKLAEIIANIEQRTDSELIAVIKETLTAVGTGQPIESVNEQYKFIYAELDRRLHEQGLTHSNDFDDLWAFYDYWKEHRLDTWASRRSFVRGMYRETTSRLVQSDEWSTIHPVITGVAKSRFDSGHFADAVEASYKEINSRIKEEVRQRTGKVLDGADLMNNAFSLNNPIIVLEDLQSEDGQNIQKGYMMMFAGAMIGIRNPKAHSNDDTEPSEAMRLIQIAGHLFSIFDTAVRRMRANEDHQQKQPDSKDKGVYVRVLNPDDHNKLVQLKKIALSHPGRKAIILLIGEDRKNAIRLPYRVDSGADHINELKQLLGEENVKVV